MNAYDRQIYYFASDFHLGIKEGAEAREREQLIIDWLDSLDKEKGGLFLLGDIFDFWHEYKTVIPKGFTRFLGKIAELRDAGMPIEVFTGNHDMWMFGYFEQEFDIPVHKDRIRRTIQAKHIEMGHGDGLGPGDVGYKRIKKVFSSPLAQMLFRWIHPDIGVKIARAWSRKSREGHKNPEKFYHEDEFILQHCEEVIAAGNAIDYFIFGHRHLPIDVVLSNGKSRYVNLGEWMHHCTYATLEDGELKVQAFKKETPIYTGI